MLGNYAFQLTSLIYNASMLSAAEGDNVVSVSSRGMALSFLGGAIGVGIMESVTSGRLIPGVSGSGYAMLPAALFFLVCSLPGIFTPKLWQKKTGPVKQAAGQAAPADARAVAGVVPRVPGRLVPRRVLRPQLRRHGPDPVPAAPHQERHRLRGPRAAGGLRGRGAHVGGGRPGRRQDAARRARWRAASSWWASRCWALNALVFSLMTWLPLVVLCAVLHGLFSGALTPTVRGAYALTFRSDYQALAFGLYGAVQRVSQGLGALLSPLAAAAGGTGATARASPPWVCSPSSACRSSCAGGWERRRPGRGAGRSRASSPSAAHRPASENTMMRSPDAWC